MTAKRKHQQLMDEQELARINRLIEERFVTGFMSNAKWVRILDALSSQEGLVVDCKVKLVWDDQICQIAIDGATFKFDYWPMAMEGMISCRRRGWYDYKEIEWLMFPSVGQDVTRIRETIQAAGQFVLDMSEDGLKLSAYQEAE